MPDATCAPGFTPTPTLTPTPTPTPISPPATLSFPRRREPLDAAPRQLNTSPRGMTGAAEGISGKGSGSRLRGNDNFQGGVGVGTRSTIYFTRSWYELSVVFILILSPVTQNKGTIMVMPLSIVAAFSEEEEDESPLTPGSV